jgi:hypothetical protein
MEFLVIMGVGTVIVVWAVIASRPKRPVRFDSTLLEQNEDSSLETPRWKKDGARSHPIGQLEYLEAIERHRKDPQHQPFPLPPPKT